MSSQFEDIKKTLESYGYSIIATDFKKVVLSRLNRLELIGAIFHLTKLGLPVNSVFDVGVADGTPALYSLFHTVPQLLIEPLQEYYPNIEQLLQKYSNLKLIKSAAGEVSGTKTLYIPHNLTGASFYEEKDVIATTRLVSVVTLDDLVKSYDLPPPYLIKLDVEGSELDVIKGSRKILGQTSCIILESNLFTFREGTPTIFDVISFMYQLEFKLYDIVGMVYRPLDGALGRVDLVFLPKTSKLLSDSRYANPEQRKKLDEMFELENSK